MIRFLHYFYLALAFAVVCLFAACDYGRETGTKQRDKEKSGNASPFPDINPEADARTEMLWGKADSILRLLSLEEKAAQTMMPAIYASDDNFSLRVIRNYGRTGFGGIVLLKGDSRAAKVLADSLRKSGRIVPFVAIDAEWGLAMRLADGRRFPTNSELPDTTSEEDMFDYGSELASECRQIGINMILGPVVDVATSGSYMRRRSFGDNPQRVSDLAVAYARGLESGGVMSVAKHFPGHGSVRIDSHKTKPIITRTLHEMDSIDLYPFRRYVEEGLSAVMVGHLALPAIDSEMQPAAVSHSVITGLLKNDLGFRGLILTDALNMKGAEGAGSVAAIKAGADIVLAPKDSRQGVEEVIEAVKTGEITESLLDSAVRKILFYKLLRE